MVFSETWMRIVLQVLHEVLVEFMRLRSAVRSLRRLYIEIDKILAKSKAVLAMYAGRSPA